MRLINPDAEGMNPVPGVENEVTTYDQPRSRRAQMLPAISGPLCVYVRECCFQVFAGSGHSRAEACHLLLCGLIEHYNSLLVCY